MRKLLTLLIVLGASLSFGQQTNQDFFPASTGLNIGHQNQRWNGYFQNIKIYGTCTLGNGQSCFQGGSGSPVVFQTNGTTNDNASLLNFVNSTSCTWTYKGNGSVSISCGTGSTLNNAILTGSVTTPITNGGIQCLHVDNNGVLSGTGVDCGAGGGGGGTVSQIGTPLAAQIAVFTDTTHIAGSDKLTVDGTKVSVTGGFPVIGYSDAGVTQKWELDSTTGAATVQSLTVVNGIPESQITNLLTDLAAKASLTSPTFSGTVTAGALAVPLGTQNSLNVAQLEGGTWEIPGVIGSTTPNDGNFNNLVINGTCTGCGGGGGSGTVTSVATTAPITGGPQTTTITVACPTCVTSTSPAAGVAHFTGGTQDSTSSLIVTADLDTTLKVPIAKGGTNATTAAAALVNLFPAGTRVGDVIYCSAYAASACTTWTLLAGNNSGATAWLQEPTGGGAPSWTVPSGAGTVAVVGAGNLTSTALVTGGGTQLTQTPSATTTLDASGNLSVAAGGSVGSADTGTPKLTFGTNLMTANQKITGTIFNAGTGFQVAGAATLKNFLRGDGTNFVSSAILAGDLPSLSGSYLALSGGGTMNGNILFTDNLYDIGAVSATRPRSGYFSNSVNAPTINATTGFRIGGAAPSGHFLSGTGSEYADNARLTDDGTTLAYTGSGGLQISALSLTSALQLYGSVPAGAFAASGTSSGFGISNDGNFYVSNAGGTPSQIVSAASLGSTFSTTATAHQAGLPLKCADVSGSGSAQACSTTPTFTPAANDCIRYTTTTANTGASLTLNVNSLGAKPIAKWLGTTSLSANDILANKVVSACYDGTNWEVGTIGNPPSGGGGGVSSFSGDGTIITNVASTGAVTATLANVGAHRYIGNNTGISAAPSAVLIAAGDLPGSGATTVNGQTCTLNSTCAVEAATAGQIAVSGGSGAALTGAADLTYSTHTFSTTASGIFDFSASTATNGLIVPSNASNTASVAGAIDYDSTAGNYHGKSGTTESIFPLISTAAPLVTNNVVKATVVSGNMQLSDAGYLASNVVTAAGTLTSTALMTGGGSKASQTPSANATLDSTGHLGLTDTTSSSGDAAFNLSADTGASSFHSSIWAGLQGVPQFQVCRQAGPQGQVIVGSAIGASQLTCAMVNQSPFAKFVVASNTLDHNNVRLYQNSTSATATMLEMNNATASGTGFYFFKANTGVTGSDTGVGSGVATASLRGDGLFTGLGVTLGANGGTGGSVVLNGSTSGSATINTSSTGVLALPASTTATNMVLTTPNLGTPSAATLTNATGLPAASVLSGALANGMTATTQTAASNDTKVATDAYVDAATTNIVTAASGATGAKKICVSSGASKTCSYTDFPDTKIFLAASCNNATATPLWNLPASNAPTAACRAGTNNLGGDLQWANNNTTTNAQFTFELPNDWDTTTQPAINIMYGSGSNTSGTVKWTFSSACSNKDGSITDDPAFNAESATTGKTMAAANRTWAETAQFTAMTSGNNCVVGSTVSVKVTSGNGTATSTVNVYQIVVTIPRLLNVTAD